jgi:hypothetical protein
MEAVEITIHAMTTQARSIRGRTLAAAVGSTLSIALLGLGAALPGQAQDSAPTRRLTPAQEAQIFPERKALLLRHHRERIETLQKGERCIRDAGDSAALRDCMRQERQDNQAQRQRHREAMRAIYERNGIELPVGGPGGGRRWGKGWGGS